MSEPGVAGFLDVRLPEEQRARIAELFRDELAKRTTAAEQAAAVAAVALELHVPPSAVAADIAEAESLERGWRGFLEGKGISQRPGPDRLIEAQAALDGLARRRERLQQRLALEQLGGKRQRIRDALDDLDRQEDRFWPLLHPPAFADSPAPELPFCKCGRQMTKSQAYRVGLCELCARATELVTGIPLSTPSTEKEHHQ